MRIRIDRDVCTGHGRCYALEPELFEPDDEGFAVAVVEELDPDQVAGAERAAGNCPEKAISVE
ncbi:MAG TPA: ferredoxin [Acidimicrobiales bacterium]|jgi:ferredoxin|nr:ferredoxin [Acidimicrobiales bacterium]